MDAGSNAVDAETPLRDHGALYAEGRNTRPRHDVSHRDRPGQSRLHERKGHGRQTARGPRAAAGDHRVVRQFSVHRRQAQRAIVGAFGNLAPHRSGAHWHARLRLRARHGLRALRRLRARRPALFPQARRDLPRRGRRELSRFARGPARRGAGRARHDRGLGEPPVDAFPRGAAQALSRNARRGRWTARAHRRPICADDRPLLRYGRASLGRGPDRGLDR